MQELWLSLGDQLPDEEEEVAAELQKIGGRALCASLYGRSWAGWPPCAWRGPGGRRARCQCCHSAAYLGAGSMRAQREITLSLPSPQPVLASPPPATPTAHHRTKPDVDVLVPPQGSSPRPGRRWRSGRRGSARRKHARCGGLRASQTCTWPICWRAMRPSTSRRREPLAGGHRPRPRGTPSRLPTRPVTPKLTPTHLHAHCSVLLCLCLLRSALAPCSLVYVCCPLAPSF